MKIAIVNIKQDKELSGQANYNIDVYALLIDNGYDVKVLSSTSFPKHLINSDDSLTVPTISNKLLKWFVYSFIVPIKLWRFDIVQYNEDLPLIFNKTLNVLFRRKQLIINTVHDLGEFKTVRFSIIKDKIRRIIVPLEIRCADKIIAVSYSTKKDLIELLKIPENKIEVIYNPVMIGIKRMVNEMDLNSCIKLPKSYFLYVSSLNHPSKNHINLIKAFELYKKNGGVNSLVLVGKKMYNSNIIMERISNSPYATDIHYLGYLNNKELSLVYKKSDVYVFPSNFEGFGRGLVEAWYFGKPIVSSELGSLKEIASDAVKYADCSDPIKLSETLLDIETNIELRNRLVIKGNKRIDYFSNTEILKQVKKAYDF